MASVNKSDTATEFWREIRSTYIRGKFTDADLVCSDGSLVPCHQLVLATISPLLRAAFSATPGEHLAVYLPDCDSNEATAFLGDFYSYMAQSLDELNLKKHRNIIDLLQVSFEIKL